VTDVVDGQFFLLGSSEVGKFDGLQVLVHCSPLAFGQSPVEILGARGVDACLRFSFFGSRWWRRQELFNSGDNVALGLVEQGVRRVRSWSWPVEEQAALETRVQEGPNAPKLVFTAAVGQFFIQVSLEVSQKVVGGSVVCHKGVHGDQRHQHKMNAGPLVGGESFRE